jgi:5-formyltetrahydrofolate cyclo-ligase
LAAAEDSPTPSIRDALRRRLLQERLRFAASDEAMAAATALARVLQGVIRDLQPQCLGLYWPQRDEFNAPAAIAADPAFAEVPLALPFARRNPHELAYRHWDGQPPRLTDDCGIPAADGAVVVPDVVCVPCVGYTRSGYRLGYGGGYFDRWLAAHSHVCSVGVAWSMARIDEAELEPQAHDVALTLILTEQGPI